MCQNQIHKQLLKKTRHYQVWGINLDNWTELLKCFIIEKPNSNNKKKTKQVLPSTQSKSAIPVLQFKW